MRTSDTINRERSETLSQAREVRSQIESTEGVIPADLSDKFEELMTRAESLLNESKEARRREELFSRLDQERVEDRVSDPLPTDEPRNRERHPFSILRAANLIASGRPLDGIERETVQELRTRSGIELGENQFIVPHSLPVRERAMTTEASSAGASIETTVSPSLIEFLRNLLTVRNLGANVLGDLTGNLSIPKQDAISSGGWKTEGTAFEESSPTVDQITLTPNRVGTYVEYTRQLVRQSSLDIENLVRNDLVYAVAAAIDSAAINGSGSGAEPAGILNTTAYDSIPTVAMGTNGGAIDWDAVVELESNVAVGNALMGSLAYLTTPGVRGQLKVIPKESGYPVYLTNDDGQLNGYPLSASNQVPNDLTKGTTSEACHAMIFGDWSSLYVALWGGSVITVNPYSKDTAGVVRLVIEQMADIALRYEESFSHIKDITV